MKFTSPTFHQDVHSCQLLLDLFWIGTVLNFIPAVLAGAIPVEWTMIGLAHLIFIIRVAVAERHAARQRADDLDHFQKLKRERPSGQAQS